MRKPAKIIMAGILFLALAGAANLVWTDMAVACGWGRAGGGDYVPQRRDAGGLWAQKPALTQDQAREIAANYVKRLNPELEIGKITDNGGFYEVEVISDGKEVVQRLGVDKQSGRLIMLN